MRKLWPCLRPGRHDLSARPTDILVAFRNRRAQRRIRHRLRVTPFPHIGTASCASPGWYSNTVNPPVPSRRVRAICSISLHRLSVEPVQVLRPMPG